MKREKTKYLAVVISTLVTAALITGCSASDTSAALESDTAAQTEVTQDSEETEVAQDTTVTEETENTNAADESPIYGQITSIDGNTIILALAESPMGSGEMPEGNAPEATDGETPQMPEGEAPATDGETPELPEGETPDADGETPELPEGEAPTDGEKPDMQGGAGGAGTLTLTGEELTITVSDSTTYTIDGETASLDGLSVDTVVFVTMDGDTVVSISSGMGAKAE